MAATVQLAESNGPSASIVETLDPANVNFGSVDAAELDPTANVITAQADGHSFEKWFRLYVSDMGGSAIVDNVKVWLSNLGGGWKTDEGISCNLVTAGYIQAAYAAGGPVDTDSTIATSAMPESEPAGSNVGIAASLGGQILSAPAYTDYFVLQLDASQNTPAGDSNIKTITFQWDEQ